MKRTLLFASLSLVAAASFAQSSPTQKTTAPTVKAVSSDVQAVQKRLQQKFPKLPVSFVSKVSEKGINDLYAFTVGGRVTYTNADVSYIFTNGNLVSAETAENLTNQHQLDANKKLFASLPKEKAFKFVFGKGERVLYTVEDADCPACREFATLLHNYKQPEKLNMTLYVFPFALEKLHPEAKAKADSIWCSGKDSAARSAAWKRWMVEGKMPTGQAVKDCKAPTGENIELFKEVGISATPTLMFTDGSAAAGGVPPENLIKALEMMQQAEKPTKK
jgi:thiol:disulfide interchange protein DsbC